MQSTMIRNGTDSTRLLLKDDQREGIECDRQNEERLTSANQKRSFWSDATRTQIAIVAFAAISNISVYICQSIPGTFLAREIKTRGGENVYAAAIINSSYLASALTSLIFGNYKSEMSTKRFICLGLLIVAITQSCLVAFDYLDEASLLAVGIITRAIQGIGLGFYNVAMLTLLWQELPDYISQLFGMNQITASVGYFFAPIVGSQLYSIGNRMMLPFVASASFVALLTVLGWAFLPNEVNKTEVSNFPTWHYILNPKAVFALGLAGVTGGSIAIYDASFTSYGQALGISVATIGWMMSISDAITLVWSLIMLYLYDIKYIYRQFAMICCLFGLFGINFVFSANEPTLASLCVAIGFFGLFDITLQNFAFVELIYQASGDDNNIKSDHTFRGRISGTWFFMLSFSKSAFGVFGTSLQTALPYYLSQTVTALVTSSLACVISLSIFGCRSLGKCNHYYLLSDKSIFKPFLIDEYVVGRKVC